MKTDKQVEKMRIRAKLCDEDREFMDELRRLFPNARLVWLKFSDGEEVGK